MAPFTGVVVDDVEDDFDSGLVERRHHLFELGNLLAEGAHRSVGRMGREVAKSVVTPIVGKPTADQEGLRHVVVDGQQLDGSDTQVLQVGDDRRIGEAGVGAAEMFRDRGCSWV